MSKWRFINCWKGFGEVHAFSLFNVWWGMGFLGVTIFNFAVEFNSSQEVTP